MRENVFENIKVVDFGWVLAGPMTVKYLADYGATVVHVESPKRPDLLRVATPYKDGIAGLNRAGYYAFWAANKFSMALDMMHPDGLEIAKKLVAWADIVADNHRPGMMEKLGLDYEGLTRIKPDIIMIRSSNHGMTGPYALQPGLGNHLNGSAGFVNLVGWPDQDPTSLNIAYTDYLAPHLAAAALVGALDYHRKTGKGQLLDISQFEAGLQFLSPSLLNYSINGIEDKRMGNYCSYAAPHAVYRCKGEDRWCAIVVFNDTEWEAFCNVLGNPQWTKDSKFNTLMGRKDNESELNKLVEDWTINYDAEEVMTLMQAGGVESGIVQNAADLYEDPQFKERAFFWKMEHEELGVFSHLGQPSILSATPAKPMRPAPCLGEHTENICCGLLGMSAEDFEHFLLNGAFGL